MAKGKGRRRAAIWVGAAMYAILAAPGVHEETFGGIHPLLTPLAAVLAVPVFALGLFWLFTGGHRRLTVAADAPAPRLQEKPFSIGRAFLVLLACYTPMFLCAYPGSFAYDVPFQLRQVFTGGYSTHHPLLHTLLLGGCVRLGQALGSINLGAALYTIIQMTALAGCFAAVCASLARRCGARAARLAVLFFAVYPLHMFMAVNATKDVLFSGLFALTLALAIEALEQPQGAGARRGLYAGLILCGAGMMLLRNNALYAVLVWLPLLALLLRRRALRVIACLLTAVVLYTGANGAMKAATGAVDGDLAEMLSWPIQQLARARLHDEAALSGEEKAAIDALMPGEAWRKYDPTVSDPVKFEFDTEEFLRDPAYYAGIWLSVGKKCPVTYINAAVALTSAFIHPYLSYNVSGYYLQMGVSREQIDQWCDFEWIEQTSPLRRVVDSLSWRFGAKGAMQIPAVGMLFNMGFIIWAMLFFVLRAWYDGRWAAFAAGLLPVLLWGTFLLGPVMAGRYVYPFVCCLPVLGMRASSPENQG